MARIIVSKLEGGQTKEEVLEIVKQYYPNATYKLGLWSGQTGYWHFEFNKTTVLQVGARSEDPYNKKHILPNDIWARIWNTETKQHTQITE